MKKVTIIFLQILFAISANSQSPNTVQSIEIENFYYLRIQSEATIEVYVGEVPQLTLISGCSKKLNYYLRNETLNLKYSDLCKTDTIRIGVPHLETVNMNGTTNFHVFQPGNIPVDVSHKFVNTQLKNSIK